jgi:hypothetical protein
MDSGFDEERFSAVSRRMHEIARDDLDRCLPVESAAELELLALNMIAPFGHPDMPPEAAVLLPRALASRGDELGVGVLVVLERLAPEPLSRYAAEARAPLSEAGISSRFDADLGTLVATECSLVRVGESAAEVFGALLQRPGASEAQAVFLVVEYGPQGGALVDGMLTGPQDPEELGALVRRPNEELGAELVAPEELARRLRDTLESMVETETELALNLVVPLLVFEHAVRADEPVLSWPQPRVTAEPESSVDPEDWVPDGWTLEEAASEPGEEF